MERVGCHEQLTVDDGSGVHHAERVHPRECIQRYQRVHQSVCLAETFYTAGSLSWPWCTRHFIQHDERLRQDNLYT